MRKAIYFSLVFLLAMLIFGSGLEALSVQAPPVFLTQWGTYSYGPSKFVLVSGVAVDGAGNVYVTDASLHRVQKFDNAGSYLTMWGGPGLDDGLFNWPRSIAVDGTGGVYVADTGNHRIQKFDSDGSFVLAWGEFSFEFVAGKFSSPKGVAADNEGNVYVADSGHHCIQKFDSDGNFLITWGVRGSGDGELNSPVDVAVDGVGNVYVADRNNHRVQKFDSGGNFLTLWGTNGTGDGEFVFPEFVAVDGAGNVYVMDLDTHRVQKFDSGGNYLATWGVYGSGEGEFADPSDVAFDGAGNAFVADSGNHRIQKLDGAGSFQAMWGMYSYGPNEFVFPSGIALDGAGDVYVTDTGLHRVQKFDANGGYLTMWGRDGIGDGQFVGPRSIAVDGEGSVYVADSGNHRIQKFDGDGNFSIKWGEYGSGDGKFMYPEGVAVDAAGSVYVADGGNNRIQKFDSDGSFLIKWGARGSGEGEFNTPADVAVDGAGNVFVVDRNNHRVQKFDSDGNYLTMWGARGSDAGEFEFPDFVTVDSEGNAYVVDRSNHRVQKFDGEGNYVTKWGEYGSGVGEFIFPNDAVVDDVGRIYVADSDNHRIQKFGPVDNAPPMADPGGPYEADEGDTIALDASGSQDPDGSIVSYEWDLDNDGEFDDGSGVTTAVIFGDNGSFVVGLRVTDDDGASDVAAAAITVLNVAPTPSISGPTAGLEGSPVSLTGSATDPAGANDTIALSWSIVKESSPYTSGTGADIDFTPDDDGIYEVTLTASDEDGGSNSTEHAVTVSNVAPEVTADAPNVTVSEGQSASNSGTFSDPGDDVVTVTASVGSITQDAGDSGGWGWLFDTADGPDNSQSVIITAVDSDGAATTTAFELVVNNAAPQVTADAPSVTVDEGQSVANSGTFSDPGDDVVTVTASVGNVTQDAGSSGGWGWFFDTTDGPDDSQSVIITAVDSDGAATTTAFELVVDNAAPQVDVDAPSVTVDEGQSVANSGTFSDPGDDVVTVTASVGSITQDAGGSGGWGWSFETGDGSGDSQTVIVTATDSDGAATTTVFELVVNNVAPEVGEITAPDEPVEAGTEISVSAGFTDAGTADTHSAVWDWGDGSSAMGMVDEANGSGSVSGSHAYAEPGVFEVRLTVTDKDGASGESVFRYVLVYGPEGGFVTGGGWFDSPAGAYVSDPELIGKARFGFVSKYKKGAEVPTGQTEFHIADMNFHSSGYEWLIVAGDVAMYQGSGTINGEGEYRFLLTAQDADVDKKDSLHGDALRIRIWSEDAEGNEVIVYDNRLAGGGDESTMTEIGGGSIVIHDAK